MCYPHNAVTAFHVLMQMKIQEWLNNSNYNCQQFEKVFFIKVFRKQNFKTVSE